MDSDNMLKRKEVESGPGYLGPASMRGCGLEPSRLP